MNPSFPVACFVFIVSSFLITFTHPRAHSIHTLITRHYRFMQALSGIAHEDGDFNIQQQSCLHGALNFKTLLYKGNGMAHKWNHTNALLPNGLYDLGACTVPQLLLGYDENLEFDYGNDDDDGGNNDDDDADYYKDDGKNPCFIDEDYYNYMTQEVFDGTWQPHYDFVVLVRP